MLKTETFDIVLIPQLPKQRWNSTRTEQLEFFRKTLNYFCYPVKTMK